MVWKFVRHRAPGDKDALAVAARARPLANDEMRPHKPLNTDPFGRGSGGTLLEMGSLPTWRGQKGAFSRKEEHFRPALTEVTPAVAISAPPPSFFAASPAAHSKRRNPVWVLFSHQQACFATARGGGAQTPSTVTTRNPGVAQAARRHRKFLWIHLVFCRPPSRLLPLLLQEKHRQRILFSTAG